MKKEEIKELKIKNSIERKSTRKEFRIMFSFYNLIIIIYTVIFIYLFNKQYLLE